MIMIDRLFKSGLITTILGMIIVIAALYMWISAKATDKEALGVAGFGLIFLRSKDSLIGLTPKQDKDGSNRGKISN